MSSKNSNPEFGLKLISFVNGMASLLHLSFWIFALFKLPDLSSTVTVEAKSNLATVYGFAIADLVLSVPLLFMGSILLWKKKLTGWLAAHMANILYWYSFIVIISRDLTNVSFAPGTIIFMPFALFSIWAAFYLWKARDIYLN